MPASSKTRFPDGLIEAGERAPLDLLKGAMEDWFERGTCEKEPREYLAVRNRPRRD